MSISEGVCHYIKDSVMLRIAKRKNEPALAHPVTREAVEAILDSRKETKEMDFLTSEQLAALTKLIAPTTSSSQDEIELSEEKIPLSLPNKTWTLLHFMTDWFAFAGSIDLAGKKFLPASVHLVVTTLGNIISLFGSIAPAVSMQNAFKKKQALEKSEPPKTWEQSARDCLAACAFWRPSKKPLSSTHHKSHYGSISIP